MIVKNRYYVRRYGDIRSYYPYVVWDHHTKSFVENSAGMQHHAINVCVVLNKEEILYLNLISEYTNETIKIVG